MAWGIKGSLWIAEFKSLTNMGCSYSLSLFPILSSQRTENLVAWPITVELDKFDQRKRINTQKNSLYLGIGQNPYNAHNCTTIAEHEWLIASCFSFAFISHFHSLKKLNSVLDCTWSSSYALWTTKVFFSQIPVHRSKTPNLALQRATRPLDQTPRSTTKISDARIDKWLLLDCDGQYKKLPVLVKMKIGPNRNQETFTLNGNSTTDSAKI